MRIIHVFLFWRMCYIIFILTVCHTHVLYSHMSYVYIYIYIYIYKVAKAPRVLHFSAFHSLRCRHNSLSFDKPRVNNCSNVSGE